MSANGAEFTHGASEAAFGSVKASDADGRSDGHDSADTPRPG